ncbi:MAG: Ppx/GppA family phosphatase, partial [Sphingomonadales bacterium]
KKAMARATATLLRFAHLCRDMAVDRIEAVATSAVRDSKNGPEFIKRVEADCGFRVKVLSGVAEARLSALGVASAFPGAAGVVGDLGGGSLELVAFDGEKTREKISLAIGPVRLLANQETFSEDHVRVVREALAQAPWLEKYRGQPFYMVGGAWRAISHLRIIGTGWPLQTLHGYQMTAREAGEFAEAISRQKPEDLHTIITLPGRRAVTLPLSAKILSEVLKILKPATVLTSAYGLREGLLYQSLAPAVRAQDPLIELCRDFGDHKARFENHGDLLKDWIEPLFPGEKKAAARIREASCYLADISWNAHADFKADLAFTRALVAPAVALDHGERAVIALSLYISYKGNPDDPAIRKVTGILSEKQFQTAITTGLALRLGQKLTGGTGHPLTLTRLHLKETELILEVPKEEAALVGESVQKELKKLAAHLGVQGEIQIGA